MFDPGLDSVRDMFTTMSTVASYISRHVDVHSDGDYTPCHIDKVSLARLVVDTNSSIPLGLISTA